MTERDGMHNFSHTRNGDAAVDGLLHGLAAGAAMLVFLVASGLISGMGLPELIAHFSPVGDAQPLVVVLGHFAVAGIYGMIWGLLYLAIDSRLRIPAWFLGIVYGTLLAAVAYLLSNVSGRSDVLSMSILLAAHLLYGLTLGLMQRSN